MCLYTNYNDAGAARVWLMVASVHHFTHRLELRLLSLPRWSRPDDDHGPKRVGPAGGPAGALPFSGPAGGGPAATRPVGGDQTRVRGVVRADHAHVCGRQPLRRHRHHEEQEDADGDQPVPGVAGGQWHADRVAQHAVPAHVLRAERVDAGRLPV